MEAAVEDIVVMFVEYSVAVYVVAGTVAEECSIVEVRVAVAVLPYYILWGYVVSSVIGQPRVLQSPQQPRLRMPTSNLIERGFQKFPLLLLDNYRIL